MSRPAPAIPPFKAVAAALRKTTEHLARELTEPTHAPPPWSEFEWAIARSVSAMQGISTLLANRLLWSGPQQWQSFLTEQRAQSLLRHASIGTLLERLDAATRDARIPCVALKGAALRALGLFRPGERPMGDIDLLVRMNDIEPIDAVMRAFDYVKAYDTRRHVVYERRSKPPPRGFGEHVENAINIEIHTVVAEPLPVRNVDVTSRLWPLRAEPGLNPYASLAALMLHLLLHAAGNMRAHALRQTQLHDIATLSARFHAADWNTLLGKPRDSDALWWAYPPLALTARYYVGCVPREVLLELRAQCPRALRFSADRRTLTDVSWSNLRVYAFPGIAWSRTALDALRFIYSRVFPSRIALAELRTFRQAQPQLDQVSWYGLSHKHRILRWVFSRPPRVQTIVSVRAALEHTGQAIH
jgi:hypothetical protein